MSVISFAELQKRTRHQLISDQQALCMDYFRGPMTVREAERSTEARYPLHRRLRHAAMRFFKSKGWDVVPHGVGVWGASAVADFAIAKDRRIVLIECLTPGWVYLQTTNNKKRLEQFFPLWFVLEDPLVSGDTNYRQRAERLVRKNRVFFWATGKSLVTGSGR